MVVRVSSPALTGQTGSGSEVAVVRGHLAPQSLRCWAAERTSVLVVIRGLDLYCAHSRIDQGLIQKSPMATSSIKIDK